MERHKSAIKAARQAVKHRERNRQVRSACRTAVGELRASMAALGAKPDKEAAVALTKKVNEVQSLLMKAAKRKILEKNAASRYVGRLSAAAHKLVSASA